MKTTVITLGLVGLGFWLSLIVLKGIVLATEDALLSEE